MRRVGPILVATVASPPVEVESPEADRHNGDQGLLEAAKGCGWFLLPNRSYGGWQGKLEFSEVYGTGPWVPSKGAN
ncbi:MAG TPA: hypothetical protein VM711_03480 [Sphingomicrobium sp.]|nr:hypothetical protein [Sphingomicrobium sp.]